MVCIRFLFGSLLEVLDGRWCCYGIAFLWHIITHSCIYVVNTIEKAKNENCTLIFATL